MRPTDPSHRAFLAALFVSILAGAPLSAASYVMMSDEALFEQSPWVAEVRILEVGSPTTDRAYTDYQVRVERWLKGSALGRVQVVRLPGGTLANGSRLWVPGVPRFVEGERAILFLAPRRDGTLGVVQYMLGAFHERTVAGRRVAVRDLAEAHRFELPGAKLRSVPRLRDFEGFGRWLSDRAAGLRRAADYDVASPWDAALDEKYTLFESGGLNVRWFTFDEGTDVTWLAHQSGVAGMTSDEFAAFETALEAWEADPGSLILHAYGGTTTASGGLATSDGVNTILWDDPNDEILGSFSCLVGGVLAIGGWWSNGATDTFNGRQFRVITQGDVVTQDGAGCYFDGFFGKNGEEVFAHEVGHALGIGHSCGDLESGLCDGDPPGDGDALMRATAHGDGRGASLRLDDRAAIDDLYGGSGLFADGFESGDTCAWSSSVPDACP